MKTVNQIKREYYSKQILMYLLIGGIITLASLFSPSLPFRIIQRALKETLKNKSFAKRKSANALYYLKKKGLIKLERAGQDIRITLSHEGKRRAGKYQINDLYIEKPKQWDGKWRIVLFDIPNTSHMIRNVFRGKLKEFGFALIQKSAWVYPFPCEKEIILLREFLGATSQQITLLEVDQLENSEKFRRIFKI